MAFTENALTVLKARYLRKDENGNIIETPEEMLRRVALALKPDNSDAFYNLMVSLDFLPNTPTLINAGRENGQLSACFVLPVEDSMDGIFTSIKNAAMIHKTGGGTGFSFSRLRHNGARVSSTGGEASGVVSFLRVFNSATDAVKQGGVRRGANMGLLRVDHPDIEDFIMCKDDTSQLTNFNLSVGITDAFIKAVENKEPWALIDPHTHQVVKTVDAVNLWQLIIHQAWKNGEPGVVFLDTVNRFNPTPELGEIESTNPCGEQPLLPYESCNLGSINLSNHVKDGSVDWTKLSETVETAVELLNAVLDHNCFPLPEIKENTLRTRKIGLGVMGWADMLLKLNVPYSSAKGCELAEKVMEYIHTRAWEYSKAHNYSNATCTTIAPTGTISMLANTSSGVEPNFSWVYTRRSVDRELYVVHPMMEAELHKRNLYNDDVLKQLHRGTKLANIKGLEDIADVWELSQEIPPEAHVAMQAAFQRYTDNAVSKTINLPNSATEADVTTIYMSAFKTGCKGVTVYRDGSRDSQVLNFEKPEEKPDAVPVTTPVRTRPEVTYGSTHKTKVGCGKLYITVNADDDGAIEIFTNTGKYGGCPAQSEATSRMVSLLLRYGVPLSHIAKQLCGIRCMNCVHRKDLNVLSCPDAIGKALLRFTGQGVPANTPDVENVASGPLCPDCGAPMDLAEGCVVCKNCGYSKCE